MNSIAEMAYDGNMSENWSKFKERFEDYCVATKRDQESDKIRIATLKHLMGEAGLEIYNSFNLSEKDKINFDKVLQQFDKYFMPKQHSAYSSYIFNCTTQQQGQSLEAFFTEVKNKAKDCKFGELKDRLIRDRIICGIRSKSMREKLLMLDDGKLTLENTIWTCRHTQLALDQAKNITQCCGTEENVNVDKLQIRGQIDCKYCGQKHFAGIRNCLAYGVICTKCNRRNHLYECCDNVEKVPYNRARSTDDYSSYNGRDNKYQDSVRIEKGKPEKDLFINNLKYTTEEEMDQTLEGTKYIICRNHKDGYCKFGDRCWFKHISKHVLLVNDVQKDVQHQMTLLEERIFNLEMEKKISSEVNNERYYQNEIKVEEIPVQPLETNGFKEDYGRNYPELFIH